MKPVRTALYRHFDAAGRLLYVGISLNSIKRTAQHKHGARWFQAIARIDIEWLPERTAALAAEAIAIARENPAWNIAGRAAAKVVAADPMLRPGWAVIDRETGAADGWYFTQEDGPEMLDYWSSEFPSRRFALIERTGYERWPLGVGATPWMADECVKWEAVA